MKLAVAQINTTVGDLDGNVNRILDAAEKAKGADLVVFPESTVPGYPCRDILYDTSFMEAVQAANADLAIRAKGLPPLLVGSFKPSGEKLYQHPALHNVAYLMKDGEMQAVQVKQLLPVYDVFYEPRWFVPGKSTMPPFEIAGKRVGVLICEDMWDEEYPVHPGADLVDAGAELLICISASPFRRGVMEGRRYHAERVSGLDTSGKNIRSTRPASVPLVFVNLVGATDELIFDGRSFVAGGEEIDGFIESVKIVEVGGDERRNRKHDPSIELFRALTLGLRDFAHKNGLRHAFVGLSGGIDSSVTAVIAAEALGAENVTGVAIPSRFTDERSTLAAKELAENLGIGFETVSLEKMHEAVEQALGGERTGGVAGENIQARLRMMVMMSYVNSRGGFLVNTSNKTELTLGYSTLYGDMAGSISPLGDVTKPEVYELAEWINRTMGGGRPMISKFVLEREPTAELREGQVDPFDYDTVSPEVEGLVNANRSNEAMRRSEHKRRQAGVILKVSEKSFGTGRMMPITRK